MALFQQIQLNSYSSQLKYFLKMLTADELGYEPMCKYPFDSNRQLLLDESTVIGSQCKAGAHSTLLKPIFIVLYKNFADTRTGTLL